MSRYARTDGQEGIADAVFLAAGKPDPVLEFLGPGGHAYDADAGVLRVETRRGVPLDVRDGSWLVRDEAGQLTHMPAEAFEAAFAPLDEAGSRSRRAPRSRTADSGDDAGTDGDAGS